MAAYETTLGTANFIPHESHFAALATANTPTVDATFV
jgi:hypothetical protein